MAGIQILIVEDDADIANMLKLFFSEKGYRIRIAPNGLDALDQCQKSSPQLIILDILLPGVDGFEICRRLRANPRTNHIPIVFLTQMDDLRDQMLGMELGADDYLTKPFYIQELLARVENTLARAERQKLVDPLTGFAGPKKIKDRLAAAAGNASLRTLMAQVEGFAALRSLPGAETCRALIQKTARVITETMDAAGCRDAFIGYGGDGLFVIIMPASQSTGLGQVLQARLAEENARWVEAGNAPAVSYSVREQLTEVLNTANPVDLLTSERPTSQ